VFVQVRETCADGAPAVLRGGSRQPCPDGVLADVFDGGREVGVAVEGACVEAIAEEVAGAGVALVEALRVDAVEAAEAVRQLSARAREDEVIVARHQAERDHAPMLFARHVGEESEEAAPVLVVTEDRAPVDALDRDVVDAVGEVAARDARHGSTLRVELAPAPCRVTLWGALGTVDMAARDDHQGQSLVFAHRAPPLDRCRSALERLDELAELLALRGQAIFRSRRPRR
jgi:hypothetical protein